MIRDREGSRIVVRELLVVNRGSGAPHIRDFRMCGWKDLDAVA